MAKKKTRHITTKQELKKAKAIEYWRETKGHVSNTCRATGVTRKTFYSWLKKDPQFAQDLIDAEAELNDDVRDVLVSKCADGDMTAVIFYLKNRHPDFQQHKANVAIQINNYTDNVKQQQKKYNI